MTHANTNLQTPTQNDWITRVLGVTLAPPSGTQALPPAEACAAIRSIWEIASAEADRQIAALQAALRQTDDEDLHEIAELGLNAITAGNKTRVMASLMMLGDGGAVALRRAGPKAVAAFNAFRAHIETDEKILACDENPFGVTVTLRDVLGGALSRMSAQLGATLNETPS